MIGWLLLSGAKDIKELFAVLRDTAAELNGSNDVLKYQVLILCLFTRFCSFFVVKLIDFIEH